MEEAASLLESNKKGDALYIDTVFDVTQSSIWTGDENDSASYLDGVWSIRIIGGYGGGSVCWCYENARNQLLTNLKWLMHIRSLLTTYFIGRGKCLTISVSGEIHEMTIKSCDYFSVSVLHSLQPTLISFVAQGCVGSGQS